MNATGWRPTQAAKREDRPQQPLAARVRAFVRTVPHGRVVTYADVAEAIGCPGGARAVGRIMALTDDKTIACHRVVRADGSIADESLAARLRSEGVNVEAGHLASFAARRWFPGFGR